ncbi:MAG TPA: glycogen synthase GlgA [Verrucomicrobiota bacterium]|nr:glycogen synthase GlgA [Verrucomicrobiota bacterium]HNU49749.1 glycogen synthase GlgA [Verrucomicrobiota bacterium]
MRILLASSEVYPYSKSGGLADMVAALGKFLARAGHDVGLVTPLYRGIRERFRLLQPFRYRLEVPLGHATVSATLWTTAAPDGLRLYFVDQPAFFQRRGLYGEDDVAYADNAARFIFLSKAVAHLARHLTPPPEVVHVHDWHVGLVPLLIRDAAVRGGWREAPGTCLTIHNLAYQGVYPRAIYEATNLPWSYFTHEGLEFHGHVSLLKAGVAYADALTAVSPQYAQEIQTPEQGCGLDGLLRARAGRLSGILNGVDYEEWRTRNNPSLVHGYDLADPDGKAANKAALQHELGLPARPEVPLFGIVSRLVDQKGIDIELTALTELLASDIQVAVLGAGQPEFEEGFLRLADLHPEKVGVRLGYNHGLAHRIEAGSDFFLMPSKFEPCGLNQMYSLRYGTIPVVRATGGLDDSVIDIREDPARANGIKFHEYSSAALAKAIRKALALHGDPELVAHYRFNGMTADFSWDRTAAEYVAVYERIRRAAREAVPGATR